MLPLVLLAAASLVAAAPSTKKSSRPVIGLTNVTKIDLGDSKRSLSGPQMGVDFPDPSLIWGDGS